MYANEFRVGKNLMYNNEPHIVIGWSAKKVARKAAMYTTKMKNLLTGSVVEETYRASDGLPEADITQSNGQFLFKSDDMYTFMDNTTYEQFEMSGQHLGTDVTKYLADNMEVRIMYLNGKAINVTLPKHVTLEVVYTEPGTKGDTASGNASKHAKLNSGVEVQVPLFVSQGDKIRVNTEDGTYVERA